MLATAVGTLGIDGRARAQDRAPPWLRGGVEGTLDRYFLLQAPARLVVGAGVADDGSVLTGSSGLDALNRKYGVISIEAVHRTPPRGHRNPALFSALGLDRMWFFELREPRPDLDFIVAAYAAVPGVERAWRDGVIGAATTPNDPMWSSQWNLQSSKLDCEDMWSWQTAETVLVSVVDTGADLTHSDLDANIWKNPGEIPNNKRDDDGNGYVDDVNGWDFWNGDNSPNDDNGHGSHVSGIIGAEGNNGIDVAGICWKATLQQVKVLSSSASGTWASIAQGVVYAADNGAVVANYSLGGQGGDQGLQGAVQYAEGLDVVQVAAAGNYGSSTFYYPAAYDGVIAVIATNASDVRPSWSDFGSWCDLCGPGDAVTSLWKNGGTNILSGTSMAAPHVTGVAAMARSANPWLDRIDTELVLEGSADDLGSSGYDTDTGWGRVNAANAFERARSLQVSSSSVAQGTSLDLYVYDPAHAGDLYYMQPCISGRTPGYSLSNWFPNDTRIVPLNPDWVTTFAAGNPGIGVFVSFVGLLDAAGAAHATLNVPYGSGLSGLTFTFSGFTVDPSNLSQARLVLNSVDVVVQ